MTWELFLCGIFLLISVPAVFFVIEVAGCFFAKENPEDAPADEAGAIAVIVPAHNEAGTIQTTLGDILAGLREQDRLVVIADNCTDDTAQVARDVGADVFERHDTSARGKGYAIQFAIDQLTQTPPAVAIIVDADCRLEEGALQRLAAKVGACGRPVQAMYLMEAQDQASPKTQITAFAWLLMNRVRMTGLFHLFGLTRLTGSGMAFPWPLLKEKFVGTGEIVEDLGFTITLVEEGIAPTLMQSVHVYGEFPSSKSASVTQRARWEHGSLAMMRIYALPLLVKGIGRANLPMITMALDLMIPPLTMLVALTLFAVLVAVIMLLATGLVFPFLIAFSVLGLTSGAIFLGWLGFGREALPLSAFSGLGAFLLEKLRVYGKTGRQSAKTWTRTDRD